MKSFRVTADDIDIGRFSDTPPEIPRRNPQRNTWPLDTHEATPGSYVFTNQPTLVKTPWELERAKGTHERRVRPAAAVAKQEPRKRFPQLPREILHCILDHLEKLHQNELGFDVTSTQKELCALSLTSRAWNRAAREHLYRNLWLPNDGEPKKRKFGFMRHESRLQSLARTLQETPGLAALVRNLRAPADLSNKLEQPSAELGTVVEIILSCPGLERTSGLTLSKRRIPAKFHYALATRRKLKEHIWSLDHDIGDESLTRSQVVECHTYWTSMETLVLQGGPPSWRFGQGLIAACLHRLPALKHLVLASFNADDFHNGTLLTLPALRSLRLDQMHGVTDEGLQQLGQTHLTWTLKSLSLLRLKNVHRLRTIQKLLATFTELKRFTLWHLLGSLGLPPGIDSVAAVSMPMLQSPSLEYLHWGHKQSTTADDMLLSSITAGGFPNLRKLRVPNDYNGSYQNLCRPIPYHQPSEDDEEWLKTGDLVLAGSSGGANINSIRYARLNAQRRVAAKQRAESKFQLVVEDAEVGLKSSSRLGGFVGDVRSGMEYWLEPDLPGSDHAVVMVEEVLGVGRRGSDGARRGSDAGEEKSADLRALF